VDERQTLALLGWTVGGVVGIVFVLNAIALTPLATASVNCPSFPRARLAERAERGGPSRRR
jgi:hypothetical protein